MIIAIPSAGRAGRVNTHKLVDNYVIVVPANEADDYRREHGDKVIAHPNEIYGIGAKRKWMLENLIDDECIWMLDDDLDALVWTSDGKKITDKLKIESILYGTYLTAKELGAYLFGLMNNYHPYAFREGHPVSIKSGYVAGMSIGIRHGSELTFDERFILKEDYDIALYNAYLYKICYLNNFYGFVTNKTFKNIGGCARIRTVEREKQMTELLIKKYGSNVVQRKRLSKRLNIRERSVDFGVNICLPF